MRIRLWQMLFTLVTVAILAAASVMSAAAMAPERAEILRAEAQMLGLTAEDICGEPQRHSHHCPFCHLLPEAAMPRFAPCHWRLVSHMERRAGAAVFRAGFLRDHARVPRAPPRAA